MPTEMQVEFTYTMDDLTAMQRFVTQNGPPTQIYVSWALYIEAFCLTFYFVYRLFFGSPFYLTLALLVDGVVVATIVTLWLITRRRIAQTYRRLPQTAPHLLTPRLLRITPGGVFQRSGAGESMAYWSALAGITQTAHAVYFWLPNLGRHTSSPQAYVAPRHAFASDAEMHQFADLAHGYLSAAQAAG